MKVINSKLNILFAIYLALIPMIISILGIFNLIFALPYYIVVWGIIYCICLGLGVLRYLLNGGKWDLKIFKNPLMVIALCMVLWIVLTSIINTTFNLSLIIYFSYFLMFICVYMLNVKWKNILLNTLLVVIAISCVMGFIDPYAKFMPGFNNQNFNMSLHFGNPNYIGHIVSALSLGCFIKFDKANTKIWNIFYCVIYLIFGVHLFMNGSFISISALIFIELIIQLVVGFKTKKFRYKMLILSLVLIPICLLVDLIPNIEGIRTCEYNYLLECVAVFDNIFNTNLLSKFGIDCIVGADGWDRSNLLKLSWDKATSSPKMFIFGGGAGMFYDYRPHSGFLSLMLDFGVIMPMLFIVFFIVLIVKIIKAKLPISKLVFLPSIICFIICYITGSVVPNSFYVFMIILGILFKDMYSKKDNLIY